ncbi:ABC transporter permease [Actibacterium sp. XHP0104]|uniref:ABC transporter permease n=1 Tax=Actibacterium sp. XHP0104 TaxID=2984335 RepID=UPI0021E94E6E|nr:ABC transporter permease [Actibacterium sp. XHP0104]MCV2882051.1 ABC transporter permease [Actibacterium sp. XHP0104]
MFEAQRTTNSLTGAFRLFALIYHATVRNIRRSHGNALIGLLMNMLQTIMFVAAFYFMFEFLGLRGVAIRGDFMLFIMSGIFLFLTHNKSLGAVLSSESSTSPMMQHAPMNTIVAISAAALSSLYIQVLSMVVVMFIYHAAMTPITIYQPIGAFGMVLLAWGSGVAIGLMLLAIKPWFPGLVSIISLVYMRANMIASGKMFVANMMPGYILTMFTWNPLFHTIDQARGFVFINYNPHFSNTTYPILLSLILVLIGLMGEFYTRKHASKSWNAKR